MHTRCQQAPFVFHSAATPFHLHLSTFPQYRPHHSLIWSFLTWTVHFPIVSRDPPPSSALQDSSSVLCLSTNWWLNLPCILQSFPEGNSELYFKIEIRVQQNVYFPALSWGFSFFYSVLHYSLVPLDMFFECSVLGVTLKWYMQSVCLLKDLWLALWTGRYFPLTKSR